MYPVWKHTVGFTIAHYYVSLPVGIVSTIHIFDVTIWINIISDIFSIFIALPFFKYKYYTIWNIWKLKKKCGTCRVMFLRGNGGGNICDKSLVLMWCLMTLLDNTPPNISYIYIMWYPYFLHHSKNPVNRHHTGVAPVIAVVVSSQWSFLQPKIPMLLLPCISTMGHLFILYYQLLMYPYYHQFFHLSIDTSSLPHFRLHLLLFGIHLPCLGSLIPLHYIDGGYLS